MDKEKLEAILVEYGVPFTDALSDRLIKEFDTPSGEYIKKEDEQMMEFPQTFDEFVNEYGFKDDKEIYTNGSELIQVFRVKQWLEHISKPTQMIEKSNFDMQQYKADLDTAYESGKHSVLAEREKGEWIPISERLPEDRGDYIIDYTNEFGEFVGISYYDKYGFWSSSNVIAWQPLPEPYEI